MKKIKWIIEDIGYYIYDTLLDIWEDRPWIYSVVVAIVTFYYYITVHEL